MASQSNNPRRNKRVGAEYEKFVAAYLREYGFQAERRVMGGSLDRGDIAGIDNWVIECKATKDIDLAGGLAEANKEKENAKAAYTVLVNKRRNQPVSKSYVTMELEQFARLLAHFFNKTVPSEKRGIARDRSNSKKKT